MDTQRLFLLIVFAMSIFFLMEAWQQDKRVKPASAPAGAPAPATGAPGIPVPTPSQAPAAAPAPVPPIATGLLESGDKVRVETDLFSVDIDTVGGDLRRLELRTHRDTLDKTKNFTLLQQQPNHVYIAQSGLLGEGLPNHRTRYAAAERNVNLPPGADQISVRLTVPSSDKMKVTKVYTFHRGQYLIDVGFEIENLGPEPLRPDAYFQLVRDGTAPAGDSAMLPTYTGIAVYTDRDKFVKVAFSDVEKNKATYPQKSLDGWIAILQHYFLSAWLPPPNTPREFFIRNVDTGLHAVGVILSVGSIEPGARRLFSIPLYAGPQDQDQLSKLAPGLDLTVDYGWLTVIAQPLFWLLQWLHQWTGNWGFDIIILTIIIKALFYPLSAASYKSMARMRVMAPRLQKLKEQYGDDRQKMNQAMMELYKTEKINPLGGCLPIVVQIPVFIALYWVLLASVELRQAPFMLWINDLSEPDPFFVLPILMGATMIFQTYLNPAPPDPVQAKIMKIMPIAFSIFFFFFPAGLVLYWLVNNILSIAQQWQITHAMEQKPVHGR